MIKQKLAYLTQIGLICLIFFGIFVRVDMIFDFVRVFTGAGIFADYGRDILVAKKIFPSDIFFAPSSSLKLLGNTPLYYWLLGFFNLFGGEVGIKVAFGIVSILTVVVALYLEKDKIGWRRYFYSALIAVSPSFVFLTTYVWQPTLVPFFILLCLLFYKKFLYSQKFSDLLASSIFYSVALFLHYTALLLLPVFLLELFRAYSHRKISMDNLLYLLAFVGVTTALFIKLITISSLFLSGLTFREVLDETYRLNFAVDALKMSNFSRLISIFISKLFAVPIVLYLGCLLLVIVNLFSVKTIKNKQNYSIEPVFIASFFFVFAAIFIPSHPLHEHYFYAFLPLVVYLPVYLSQSRVWYVQYLAFIFIFLILFNSLNKIYKEFVVHVPKDQTAMFAQVEEYILDQVLIDNKLRNIYFLDEYCVRNRSLSECVTSDWGSPYFWERLEERLGQKLVYLVKGGNNIRPISKSEKGGYDLLLCPANLRSECETKVDNDSLCFVHLETVKAPPTDGQINEILIYKNECR